MHRPGVHGVDAHKRQDLTYRFATAADFIRFYGEPQKMTTRAVAILLNDKPVGIIGLAYGLDCATLYSDSKPEIEPHMKRMTVLRAIKLAMTMVESCGREVYAKRQGGTDIVERLGFEHLENEVYRWPS